MSACYNVFLQVLIYGVQPPEGAGTIPVKILQQPGYSQTNFVNNYGDAYVH
jgi:hypothetical protein